MKIFFSKIVPKSSPARFSLLTEIMIIRNALILFHGKMKISPYVSHLCYHLKHKNVLYELYSHNKFYQYLVYIYIIDIDIYN